LRYFRTLAFAAAVAAIAACTALAATPTTIPIGTTGGILVSAYGSVWTTDLTENKLIRIDPQAAAILHRHKVGDHVTLALGGKQDPSFGGGPLNVTGEIIHLSDGSYTGNGPILGGITHSFGPTAVLRVQGIDILVVTQPGQMLDLMQVRTFGIEPATLRFLVVKSMQHFRAAFEPIAGKVIVCDSGALATPQAHLRPYTRVHRPVWPLDRTGFGIS